MKRYKKGYTQGVYDMFHIGHLNLINHAKEHCDHLVVAVNSDSLVEQYKHKTPVVCEEERRYIVENIKAVDEAVIADTLDKVEQFKKYGFDAIFIGDDWKGNERWKQTEIELREYGVDVVYLPHTQGISSTILREEKGNQVKE
ncbi:MAG: adenylyltransferase/cytidyltransferase family protein [Ruminococcus sp.]|nr:adenylyltransferase/cytidyltransferase family protein [Ruminococcus sp.]